MSDIYFRGGDQTAIHGGTSAERQDNTNPKTLWGLLSVRQ